MACDPAVREPDSCAGRCDGYRVPSADGSQLCACRDNQLTDECEAVVSNEQNACAAANAIGACEEFGGRCEPLGGGWQCTGRKCGCDGKPCEGNTVCRNNQCKPIAGTPTDTTDFGVCSSTTCSRPFFPRCAFSC